jgi:hypothetical protein
MSVDGKAKAIEAAYLAIEAANSWNLTEKEKSYLCDHVFQTALKDTREDGTVRKESQYPNPKVVVN